MTAPTFHIVPQHVARNPVARALARQQIAAAVRVFQTRLHMLADGEEVHSDIDASIHVLEVARQVLQQRGQDEPVIRGAISACVQCARRGFRWHTVDAVALDQALTRAEEVYRSASAQETQRAFWAIQRAKEQAQ